MSQVAETSQPFKIGIEPGPLVSLEANTLVWQNMGEFLEDLELDTSFVDHLCFLCLVFLMLSGLFIAALWSPTGKGLTSWLLLVMFIVFLLLSHVVSWVRRGT